VLTSTFLTTPPPSGVCNGFSAIPGTTGDAVEVVSGNAQTSEPSFRITFTVPAATLKADGIPWWQALFTNVCLGAKRFDGLTDPSHAWIDAYGQKAVYDSGTGFYWGIVPLWSPWLPSTNPYIAERYINLSGDLVIVLVKPYPWDGWAYV